MTMVSLMDVISHHVTPGSNKSLEQTVCMILLKIFSNVLFSLCGPVDFACYLICPKHTSLILAAGCVRGSACHCLSTESAGLLLHHCSPSGRPAEGSMLNTASSPTAAPLHLHHLSSYSSTTISIKVHLH